MIDGSKRQVPREVLQREVRSAARDRVPRVEEKACECVTAAQLEGAVRRCELLWRIVEGAHEKGADPMQLLSELPCVPVSGCRHLQLLRQPITREALERMLPEAHELHAWRGPRTVTSSQVATHGDIVRGPRRGA